MYNSPAISMTQNTADAFVEHEFPSGNGVTKLTDNEIISLFNARNERALSAVSEKYGINCSRIAKNILKNDQDAEECVNDTYLKVWESIPPEQPDSLCAYTARITRSFAIDRCSGERSEKRGGETALILGELAECVSDNSGADPADERREILSAVNEYLETLPLGETHCVRFQIHFVRERKVNRAAPWHNTEQRFSKSRQNPQRTY